MLPRFRKDQQLWEISSTELNEWVRATEKILHLQTGRGIAQLGTPFATELHLEEDRNRGAAPKERRCLIVEEPQEEHNALRLREVTYQVFSPRVGGDNRQLQIKAGKYVFRGPVFRALPEIGYIPADYTGLVWLPPDGVEHPQPTTDETYLTATWVGPYWKLSPPPAGETGIHVVIRSITDPLANYIMVQDVIPERTGAGTWDGFRAVGEVWAAGCHPYSDAGDYEAFIWPERLPFDHSTPILTAEKRHGAFWVQQYVRWELPTLARELIFNDCTAHLVRGT